MKPKQPDLFRSQLSQTLKLSHPLCRLAINWDRLEQKIDVLYSEGVGQPPLPTRLMVGLHYLKYIFDERAYEKPISQQISDNPKKHL